MKFLLVFLVIIPLNLYASTYFYFGNDTLSSEKNDTSNDEIHIRTYLDFHYAFDANMPSNRIRPFGSNPLNVNQFDLGYAFAEISYKTKKFRAVYAMNSGCIVERMYIMENEVLKRIREMSGEYFFTKKISVEGGIMPAMYGFESFINKENWFSTRAVMTDFAPDFDFGARFTYRKDAHWTFRFQVSNGWQVLRETNNNKAIGTLVRYDSERLMVNWGTMLTNESTIDSINLERFYSNFFAKIHLGKKWQIAPLWDFGLERDSNHFHKINFYTSACINLRYQFTPKVSLAARYEYFYDPKQIIPDVIRLC